MATAEAARTGVSVTWPMLGITVPPSLLALADEVIE